MTVIYLPSLHFKKFTHLPGTIFSLEFVGENKTSPFIYFFLFYKKPFFTITIIVTIYNKYPKILDCLKNK